MSATRTAGRASRKSLSSHLIDAVYWLYALGDLTVRVVVYCWIILALVVLITYLASSARLWMVGAAGLQPATPCLEGRCSMPLSYAPQEQFPVSSFRFPVKINYSKPQARFPVSGFQFPVYRESQLDEIDLSLGCPHGYKPLPFSRVCLWRLL